MRWLLVFLAACNQVYGLDETKLRFDAPPVDGPGCSDGVFVGPSLEGWPNGFYMTQPQVRHDLRELWFQYNGDAMSNGSGIYFSRRTSPADPWGTPVEAAFSGPDDFAPALSGDGLHLFFLSYRPGGRIWEATRASIADDFTNVALPPLGLEELDGTFSIDISFDGKTLYAQKDKLLYELTRPAFDQPFANARVVASDVDYPSVSPDGLELFYNDPAGTKLMRQTRSTTTATFETPTQLRPEGEDPDLAANGKSLYVNAGGKPGVLLRDCP